MASRLHVSPIAASPPLAAVKPPRDTSRESLEQMVLAGDFVVPVFPAVALELRRLLDSDRAGLAEVANVASADPALAATLLKLANSANHRGAGPTITTLTRAVYRLGARSVALIAAAVQIGGSACAEGSLVDLKYRVWRRSVSTALACQKLAPARGLDDDAAFLSGLLHGFGRSVALGCLERVLARAPGTEPRSAAEWLESIEPHRLTLARRVAEQWQLPAQIIEAVAPSGAVRSPMASLVMLAERIVAALEAGAPGAQVAALPELTEPERKLVARFTDELGPALEGLLQAPESTRARSGPSLLQKPQSTFRTALRPLALPLVDLRNRRAPEKLQSIGVAPDGISFGCQRPMQEGCVARLGLGEEPKLVEGWFSVALCQSDKSGYRVEAQPFAASAELRELLMRLWSSA